MKFIIFAILFFTFQKHTFAKVLAKLGSHTASIEEAEFKAKAFNLGSFNSLNNETKELILTKIIQEKLLEEEAKSQKLDKLIEYQNTARSLLIVRLITQNEEEIEKDALKLYEQSKKEFEGKKTYTFSHILLKDEEEAKKLQAEIFAKKNFWKQKFKEVARERSLDIASARNNGNVGKVPETMLPKDLSLALSKMKTNLLYGPVQTSFGFHLIFVDEVEDLKIPSFGEVKQKFISQIISKKTEEKALKLQDSKKIKFSL